MKVLHVVPTLGRQSGGLTSAVVGLAAALQDMAVDVVIHSTDLATPPQARQARRGLASGDLPHRFDELNIVCHPVRFPTRLLFSAGMLQELRAEAETCDLIHIHGLFLYPQFAAMRAALETGTPYIVSTHGMLHPHFQRRGRVRKWLTERLWQGRMLRKASMLHATSETERRVLLDSLNDRPVVTLPNGLNIRSFMEGATGQRFRESFGLDEDMALITYHGRIASVKGLDLLVEALPSILQKIPHAKVVIIGPDDEGLGDQLRLSAASLGVGGDVLFTGPLEGPQLSDALDAAHVWVLPSRSDSFGMAALEAMALGKSVVASKHVDIAPEAAKANALVMIENEKDALSRAIISQLLDREGREALGARARRFAFDYDWTAVAPRFIDLYTSVVREGQK